jgi:hypothetical protein
MTFDLLSIGKLFPCAVTFAPNNRYADGYRDAGTVTRMATLFRSSTVTFGRLFFRKHNDRAIVAADSLRPFRYSTREEFAEAVFGIGKAPSHTCSPNNIARLARAIIRVF